MTTGPKGNGVIDVLSNLPRPFVASVGVVALGLAGIWYNKYQDSLTVTLNQHTGDLRDLRTDVRELRKELVASTNATNSRLASLGLARVLDQTLHTAADYASGRR